MKVFVDKHHEGLFKSLILLFEKRLGWELYTQAGLQWYEEGLWNVYPHIDTAKQYLLREVEKDHGITREQFKQMNFDLILCSIPEHVEPFLKLAQEKNCKICFQIGNVWQFDHNFKIKNILAASRIPELVGFHTQIYHEEFDTTIFSYAPPTDNRKVYSFINGLGGVDIYSADWALFLQLEKMMPDWEFKAFGGLARDGTLNSPQEVADKMREATFIFNSKKDADGYGFSIHEAMAVGRPVLVNYGDYQDKLAGEKLIPDVTCIDVDNKSPEQIKEQLEYLVADPIRTWGMGQNLNTFFHRFVDFNKEQEMIQLFLDNLM